MKTSVVNVRVDDQLKRRAIGRARHRGTTLSFVITKCLRAYVRGELPSTLLGEGEGAELRRVARGGVARRGRRGAGAVAK